MKIALVPKDESACAYYRIVLPAIALAQKGYQAVISTRENDFIPYADIVVIQRETRPHAIQLVQQLKRAGKKVVMDLDDNFFQLEPENPAFKYFSPYKLKNLEEIISLVDAVTVTTKTLADSLVRLNRNIFILPNFIDEKALQKEAKTSKELILGWQGGHSHFLDLKLIKSSLNSLLSKKPNLQLILAGFSPGKGFFKRYIFRPWIPTDIDLSWFANFADFTVGICPLRKSPFNECKSDIKFVEYASLGIPTVASNIVTYQTIKHKETGFLARNLSDWENYLTALLEDESLRQKIGQAAKEYVIAERLIQNNIWRWVEVYQNL